MAIVRIIPIAFRFDPEVKRALAQIASRDGRSTANMMEWLVCKHCEREGLSWPLDVQVKPDGQSAAAPKSAAAKPKAARNVRKTNQA